MFFTTKASSSQIKGLKSELKYARKQTTQINKKTRINILDLY
jgi:hypothetical protein